ncbi:olfactory receptor 10G4-like [Acipenser oxyrinchus oxyrinchus]|uniref:Olfactory receptor 10G4-like n=1 Tax=Acipenser oxyrinchus oxyrinchus TaxID=40147 RepID=A0AAD8G461_ACIOX|nr:olfactory receptor 10G4-like [Acipenser oxyrinchus oxyrinchus]
MALQNGTADRVTEFIITGLDDIEHPKAVGTVILVVYSLILLGSLTNICFIALDQRLHTPMYFFICTLAAVDILYTSSVSIVLLNILLGEVKRVPYGPCVAQLLVFHLGSTMEPFAIALMAYDRLIAISNPLRYHSILTKTRILVLTIIAWMLGFTCSGLVAGIVNRLPYCHSNTLKYSFCEYAALVRVACVNPDDYFLLASIISSFVLFGNFVLIVFSYLKIILAVLKISSTADRKKMFSTCSSHLIVVACFFIPKFVLIIITRIGLVLTLSSRNGLIIGSTLGPSLVNPFVYCLRTKELRSRLLKIFSKQSVIPSE